MSSFPDNPFGLVGDHLEKHSKMREGVRDQEDTPHHLGLGGIWGEDWGGGGGSEGRSSWSLMGWVPGIRGDCPVAPLTQDAELPGLVLVQQVSSHEQGSRAGEAASVVRSAGI